MTCELSMHGLSRNAHWTRIASSDVDGCDATVLWERIRSEIRNPPRPCSLCFLVATERGRNSVLLVLENPRLAENNPDEITADRLTVRLPGDPATGKRPKDRCFRSSRSNRWNGKGKATSIVLERSMVLTRQESFGTMELLIRVFWAEHRGWDGTEVFCCSIAERSGVQIDDWESGFWLRARAFEIFGRSIK